jgi:FAD/FMN-containing dehydrogenase
MSEVKLPRFVRRPISGWGRNPIEECDVFRPEDVSEVQQLVADAPQSSLTPRGYGRSYGDASLNREGAVLLSERLNHMMSFDEATCVLRCQSGVTLAEIIEHLLPRGYFFPVTPGTKSISIGGAIAADVHGKNHHSSGAMSAWVDRFSLLTGTNEILDCSRDQNPEVFWATIGGMGLTGVILEAELRLKRVETAFMDADYEQISNIDTLLERMAETDEDYDYAVAWVDSLASGTSLGRSVLMQANHAPLASLQDGQRDSPHLEKRRRRPGIPFTLPNLTLNPLSMKAFNAAFYAVHPTSSKTIGCDRFFYPLDSVAHWNRAYGRRGVIQYQCVIPKEHDRSGIIAVLEALTKLEVGSFLTVLKTLGPASKGLLSFPLAGQTLALDVPYTGPRVFEALRSLDEIVLAHGGRVYLAKDACMKRESFERMYPNLAEFKKIRKELDPHSRFESSLARRLGIVEAGA